MSEASDWLAIARAEDPDDVRKQILTGHKARSAHREEPDMPNDAEPLDLVTIIESPDATLLALMKALLDDAGIPYLAKGEALQNLFGLGQFGTGFNPLIGTVRIEVRRDQADAARALLSDFLRPRDTTE